jgi:hypothetical protein
MDNDPTPFIDMIINECADSEIVFFMDGFSSYNQIYIKKEDQHKTTFFCHVDGSKWFIKKVRENT